MDFFRVLLHKKAWLLPIKLLVTIFFIQLKCQSLFLYEYHLTDIVRCEMQFLFIAYSTTICSNKLKHRTKCFNGQHWHTIRSPFHLTKSNEHTFERSNFREREKEEKTWKKKFVNKINYAKEVWIFTSAWKRSNFFC